MNLYHWVIIHWEDAFWLRSLDCSGYCVPVRAIHPAGWVESVSLQPWASPGALLELQWLLDCGGDRAKDLAA